MRIILGSASPRRKELFAMLGYPFTVAVSHVCEVVEYTTYPEMVEKIALKKAHALLSKYPDDLIITADTIVVCKNQVLGKPIDLLDARRMIGLLAGKNHSVYTAVAIQTKEKQVSFVHKSTVSVGTITKEEIEEYIHTKEPYDKAGGYGIQGQFAKYIENMNGDFYSVMGLPIQRLYQELKAFNLEVLDKSKELVYEK